MMDQGIASSRGRIWEVSAIRQTRCWGTGFQARGDDWRALGHVHSAGDDTGGYHGAA